MKILTVPEHCTRPAGSACERCRVACPAKAISFTDGGLPVIDKEACTKCGICIGVCDGFTSSAATTLRLYEHLRKVAMRGEIVYLTCEENVFPGLQPADNVTVLPCLACIPAEMWTLLLAQNAPLCIACDLKYCEDCSKAAHIGELLFTKAIEIAVEQTGTDVHFDRIIPEAQPSVADEEDEAVGRRAAFDHVKDDAFGIISGKRRLKQSDTLKEAYRKKERERMRATLNLSDGSMITGFGDGAQKRIMQPKRRMMLEALVAQPDIAGRSYTVVSACDHDLCVESLDCANTCPTGARIVRDGEHMDYDARYCVGCGACVAACPRKAIELVEVTLDELLPQGPGVPATEPDLSEFE